MTSNHLVHKVGSPCSPSLAPGAQKVPIPPWKLGNWFAAEGSSGNRANWLTGKRKAKPVNGESFLLKTPFHLGAARRCHGNQGASSHPPHPRQHGKFFRCSSLLRWGRSNCGKVTLKPTITNSHPVPSALSTGSFHPFPFPLPVLLCTKNKQHRISDPNAV